MRPRAPKGVVPETALDAGDRKATIADAIAAPAAAKKLTPGVAADPAGPGLHVHTGLK
jgi:hypothetical protein